MPMFRLLWLVLTLCAPILVSANSNPAQDSSESELIQALINTPAALIYERVQETKVFYGLASYYNNVSYFIVDKDDLRVIGEGEEVELNQTQWLAVVGRYSVLLVRANGLSINLDDSKLIINSPNILIQPDTIVRLVTKPELPSIALELDQIRYSHLWDPFSWLAKLVESSLVAIQTYTVSNWVLSIVVFSVLLKLLLLPVSVMTVRIQRKVSQVQAKLAPQMADIKANYDGEEAHNRMMAAHKEQGVTLFYTLKPMLGSFIQIPILIAVFNALGEMPQLNGQSFMWINNLAYPDVVAHLSISMFMFGDTISLLPLIMSVVTIFATMTFTNSYAPEAEVKRQRRNLYLMTLAFFILFYPFPAAMVFYWTLNNILHGIQQQIIKI